MPPRQELSGRERVARALHHEVTDRIPIGMVCAGINPRARHALADFLAMKRGMFVDEYLDGIVDIVEVSPVYRGPPQPADTNIWGVQSRDMSRPPGGCNEIRCHPLAAGGGIPDLDAHRWPDPDWFDYESLPEVIDAALKGSRKCVMVGKGNIFETSRSLRGFEQMMTDVMTREELVHRIMSRVTDFFCAFFTRVLEAAPGRVDLILTADDIGDQRGLLMPLEKWERLLKPHHRRLNEVIHGFGAKVIYHTDGSVMQAVDGLIDMGIDVLQALQFNADTMDPAVLKDRYGSRLCFEGGVSVQTTAAEEVRQEVQERIRVLGKGGGYILGPSHEIPAGTPPAGIAAMFDTAMEYYPFQVQQNV